MSLTQPLSFVLVSQVFRCQLQHFQIASVSGHTVRFIFKTCQIVEVTSRIRQFHEFFNLIFGRFLTFGTTVYRAVLGRLGLFKAGKGSAVNGGIEAAAISLCVQQGETKIFFSSFCDLLYIKFSDKTNFETVRFVQKSVKSLFVLLFSSPWSLFRW